MVIINEHSFMSNTFCKSHRLSSCESTKLGSHRMRANHGDDVLPISHNLITKVRSCWPQSLFRYMHLFME